MWLLKKKNLSEYRICIHIYIFTHLGNSNNFLRLSFAFFFLSVSGNRVKSTLNLNQVVYHRTSVEVLRST